MASEPDSGHVSCIVERRTRLAWIAFIGAKPTAQLIRTAVYGTVRTVVWEGRTSDRPPYPDRPRPPAPEHQNPLFFAERASLGLL